jgi:hypothetical protein
LLVKEVEMGRIYEHPGGFALRQSPFATGEHVRKVGPFRQ